MKLGLPYLSYKTAFLTAAGSGFLFMIPFVFFSYEELVGLFSENHFGAPAGCKDDAPTQECKNWTFTKTMMWVDMCKNLWMNLVTVFVAYTSDRDVQKKYALLWVVMYFMHLYPFVMMPVAPNLDMSLPPPVILIGCTVLPMVLLAVANHDRKPAPAMKTKTETPKSPSASRAKSPAPRSPGKKGAKKA